jgi:hypothetical protein
MRTLFIQDNFECHFVSLLSFTQQLFSSQLLRSCYPAAKQAIAKYNGGKTYLGPKLCGNSTFSLDRATSEP